MTQGTGSQTGSVSGWITLLRHGNPEAARLLVKRYFKSLCRVAERKLRERSIFDRGGDDLANEVMTSLFENAREGDYPNLHDRYDLWLLLIVITHERVIDQVLNGPNPQSLGATCTTMTDLFEQYNTSLEKYFVVEPEERITDIHDCWQSLLATIPDENSRRIAQMKLEGFSHREIARQLNLVPRTVDRKARMIAERWNDYLRHREL
jgi:DNA-directed RNA polymerase specialized sigma24 family protein